MFPVVDLRVVLFMYFETPSILTPLLTNFAVAVFVSNHTYSLLSRYEYFHIAITIINSISIYQYIAHITIARTDKMQSNKQTHTHAHTHTTLPAVQVVHPQHLLVTDPHRFY